METPPDEPASVRSGRVRRADGSTSSRLPTPARARVRTGPDTTGSREPTLPAVGRPSRRRVLGRVPRLPRHPLRLGSALRPVRAARRLGVPVARHRARREPPRAEGVAARDGDGAHPVRRRRGVPRLRRCHRRARRDADRRPVAGFRDLHQGHRRCHQRHVRHEPQRSGGDRRLQRPQRCRCSSSSATSRTTS